MYRTFLGKLLLLGSKEFLTEAHEIEGEWVRIGCPDTLTLL